MPNVGNWTVENCSTVGTGALILTGAELSFTRFRDSIPTGDVYYVIEDGINRESGVGAFNGAGTITRTAVYATLTNTVYNDSSPAPLSLSGNAVVACTLSKTAYDVLADHVLDVTGNPHATTLEQARTSNNVLAGDVDMGGSSLLEVDTVAFTGGQALSWNATDLTLDIPSGLGPVLQVGQESYMLVHNDTGVTITNGSVVMPNTAVSDRPSIILADSSSAFKVINNVLVTTMDIPDGTVGVAINFGFIRGIDTSMFNLGDPLYVSATTPGLLTNVRPEFPNYNIQVGGVIKVGASGDIFINPKGDISGTFQNFFNGIIREGFEFTVTSDGATITGHLAGEAGITTLTYVFSDGFTEVDVTTPLTLTFTAGLDTAPLANYVYITQASKTLVHSTVGWPVEEHIKISIVALQSATQVQQDGALLNQNTEDHIIGTDGQGHLSHITQRIRLLSPEWISGTEGTVTLVGASTPDDVFFAVTGGEIFQLHSQTFPAMDMATGDNAHIVNNPTTPYVSVTNLNTQIVDANNNTLNNKSFSFVAWGIVNKTGEPSHMMINLPSSSYAFNAVSDAISDPNNYSIYTIPSQFRSVGFLIARFTMTYKNNAWTLESTEDLRGSVPNISAGGGVGGVGVTTYLGLTDTFNAYAGLEGFYTRVNALGTGIDAYDLDTDIATINQALLPLEAYSGKNYLQNGDFTITQRGGESSNTAITTGEFFLDRYRCDLTNVIADYNVNTVNTMANAQNSTLTFRATTGSATGIMRAIQVLPNADFKFLQGRTMTLTALYRSNNANARIGVWDGSYKMGADITLSDDSWLIQSYTFTVSTNITTNDIWIYANIVDADGSTSVNINTNDYIQIGAMQLEEGSEFTGFEWVDPQINLAQCQRYYWRRKWDASVNATIATIQVYSTQDANGNIATFPVTMRTLPTVAISNLAHFDLASATGVVYPCTIFNVLARDTETIFGSRLQVGSSVLVAGNSAVLRTNNLNAWIEADAEV